jgi:hypothetical protein
MNRNELREAIREVIREELGLLYQLGGLPEPIYTVDVACAAIPCDRATLRAYLKRGGFESLYRWFGIQTRRYRVIPASQVQWVRDQLVRKHRKRHVASAA